MTNSTHADVNDFLQKELRRRGVREATAVEAAQWLDAAGVLKDRPARPGLPLRDLLREGAIRGSVQRPRQPNGRWFICQVDSAENALTADPRDSSTGRSARARRIAAAERYKPKSINLLLIAEAPPSSLDRYFYFEDVLEHDSLFRYVVRGVLGREPTRDGKGQALAELKDRGVFLIDLREEPVDGTALVEAVPELHRRIVELAPRKVILIKATVFDAAYPALRRAGIPVSSVRVPFPGSGQQQKFLTAFAQALHAPVGQS